MSSDNYNGLMSDEFCQTPQYLGSLDEVKAVRKAMALRCLEQGRKIILIHRLSMDDVKVICDGKEELFTPWESPKGKRLQFEAEVKNIIDGTSQKQMFDIMSERTALLDGGIVIEGVDAENVPYTISEFDFSVLIPFGIGIAVTVLAFARLVNMLFKKHYAVISRIILGFVISSSLKTLPYEFKSSWTMIISIICCALGFVVALAMEKAENKQKQ